ncbi:Elongation_factor 1-gamma [Hexamita inflata]|uniref:Elongation factor 1-gamma n=1 Tax=Hexamita inflata TaxID=28002 RepID=A0AA86P6V5_9EUKA|nr:Elongation factor 1-gamma [Hexamita inflata]CAI9931292.1 Elongation factor 1-gamma [Hexamita inflata]
MKVIASCECNAKIVKLFIEIFGFECEVTEQTQCGAVSLVDGDITVHHMPAIIRYIGLKAKCPCYFGRELAQITEIDSMIEWAQNMANNACFLDHICSAEGASLFHPGFAKNLHAKTLNQLNRFEKFMSENTFAVRDRISIADFYLVAVLQWHIELVADKTKYQNVFRYMNMIAAQFPVVTKFLGEFKFAEQDFVPKAFKVEKPAKEDKKEEAKKDEPMDDEPKQEEKKAIKYSYKMDLNAWKRHYKNLDWSSGADWQQYFYENFTGEDMSLWLIDYKDCQNFKEDWKTKNLTGMLLQRLRGDKADQNCFGNFIITKTDEGTNFQICGVFLFPGKEVMQEWTECSGTQSFNFTRIDDWQNPEVKTFIKRNWDWSEEEDMIYHGHNYGKCSDGNGDTFV